MPIPDHDPFPGLPDPPDTWVDENGDPIEPTEAPAWGGPLDGEPLVAWVAPAAVYCVRGPARLFKLIEGREGLERHGLLPLVDGRRRALHPAVVGCYAVAEGTGGRQGFRYTDYEYGRRPPRDPALDWIEGLPRPEE